MLGHNRHDLAIGVRYCVVSLERVLFRKKIDIEHYGESFLLFE
jgi:hypothetical protein